MGVRLTRSGSVGKVFRYGSRAGAVSNGGTGLLGDRSSYSRYRATANSLGAVPLVD